MMTKKNYTKAAEIVRNLPRHAATLRNTAATVERAFTEFFQDDNPRFDVARFHEACAPKTEE